MRRGTLFGALLAVLIVAGAAPAAHAQSIWVTTNIEYENNTVYGTVECEPDPAAEMYYDITVSGSMWDDQNTANDGGETDPYDPYAIDFSAQNPSEDDAYHVSGSAIEYLDSAYALCGCPTCFYVEQLRGCSRGCPVCCSDWSGEDLPGRLTSDDPESDGTPNPGPCGPTYGDLDQLIAEYQDPSTFGSSVTGSMPWVPTCSQMYNTAANPTPYAASYAFSGSTDDTATDWAAFQPQLLSGLSLINNTAPPAGLPTGTASLPAQPLAISQVHDTLYRTPKESWDDNVNAGRKATPLEAHQFGLAVDFGPTSSNWTTIAAWAEWTNGEGGPYPSTVCLEPEATGGSGHVHVDWRPQINYLPECPNTWFVSFPDGWPN